MIQTAMELAWPLLMAGTVGRKKRTLAEYVLKTREMLGLTQAELADKLGMERRTVMRYETGQNPVPKHVYLALKQLRHEHKKRAARR